MELKVSEIFYSLQGEGIRKGCPSIFIRLQGCSAKHACYASGVRCDTEFESGESIELNELWRRIQKLNPFSSCRYIVWTGGEPLDQLNEMIVAFFSAQGYLQSVETSGIKPLPTKGFDLVSISPKVAEHVLSKNFDEYRIIRSADLPKLELRYVRHSGQTIPKPSLNADYYFLSPHFDGGNINYENIEHCTKLCLDYPEWRLSVQEHKLLNIL